MGSTTGLAEEQRRTLGRLKAVRELGGTYLAGDTGLAYHLRHRTSLDLDLFSEERAVDLAQLQASVLAEIPETKVLADSQVTLSLRVGARP